MQMLTMRLLRFPLRFALLVVVLGAALLWLPASVFAAPATPTDDEVNAVASQIYAFFAEQYGTRVLASPPFTGASVLFWLVPLALLSAGVVVLVRTLRKPAPAAHNPAVPVSAAHAARLERELDDWR